jgi:predicted membrane protein
VFQDEFRSLKLVIEVNLLKVIYFTLCKLGLRFHQRLKGVTSLTTSKDQYKLILILIINIIYEVLSSTTNNIQHYTVVFITTNVLHVLSGFSTHHQELKTVCTTSGICRDFSASYRYRE